TPIDLVFNNTSGSVQVQSGTLNLAGGGNQSGGSFTAVNAANVIQFGGNTHTLSGSGFGGAGIYLLANGTVTVSAPTSMPHVSLVSGTLNGAQALTITGTGAWSGGTMS